MKSAPEYLDPPDPRVIERMDEHLLDATGRLNLIPWEGYHRYIHNDLRCWCQMRSRYGLPTQELVDWLQGAIGDPADVLEIGAGQGDLGHRLGIRMTDSFVQQEPLMQALYATFDIGVTAPPPDVEKLEGYAAVRKYKPRVVLASWVTQKFALGDNLGEKVGSSVYGVNEVELLKCVDEYIFVGNMAVHGDKRLFAYEHEVFFFPWMKSRGGRRQDDFVAIWKGGKKMRRRKP